MPVSETTAKTRSHEECAPPLNRTDLASRYRAIRARSEALCAPLATEDYGVQPMDDASPPKWHLAHTAWFFETFVLKDHIAGYQPFHPAFEMLFNSYYNGVGQPFPRARRGTLSRPTVAEIFEYRQFVDERLLLALPELNEELASRVLLGLHHEQQHQELLLTDIKYNLGNNPLLPAFDDKLPEPQGGSLPMLPVSFDGGLVEVGCAGAEFAFDNEFPRHQQFLAPYALGNRLVTNAEYQAFTDDGGYRTASLWLSEAWDWIGRESISAPLYWLDDDREYRLGGAGSRIDSAPVCHLSFFEADAFARWAGARLPSEAEWEHAAQGAHVAGRFATFGDDDALHPQGVTTLPAGESLAQLFGDVWEWTQTAYGPYPGYRPDDGALGEYNGKFMSSQRVLKGGSVATPPGHVRCSYRNFFYPADRWQFSGLRLAFDR